MIYSPEPKGWIGWPADPRENIVPAQKASLDLQRNKSQSQKNTRLGDPEADYEKEMILSKAIKRKV